MHGGDQIAEVLKINGVRSLYTLCGGHISPILAGAKARGIRIVDVRHEVTSVFAADASARLSGIPGVAAVTAGPGLTNTITAVKNAQLAQSPVVILGGAAPTVLKGRGALQDIDQKSLMKPHVKAIHAVRRVRDLAPALDQALRQAREGVPGPVFIECPIDILYEESMIRGWYTQAGSGNSIAARAMKMYLDYHLARQFAPARVPLPDSPATVSPPPLDMASVQRVKDALQKAKKPLLVIGSQALVQANKAAELAAAVNTLGIPVYLSGMARGLLGQSGHLHMRHKRRLALKEADCVLLAGVPCDFRLDYGGHIRRGATYIGVNRSRHDLNMNRRPTIAVQADAGDLLRALAKAHGSLHAADSGWLQSLRNRDEEREAEIDREASVDTQFLNPIRLLKDIDAVLDDDSVIIGDGGDFVATASYTVRPRGPLSWLDPGAFGTLGVGAGFAIGARCERPGSEVWVLYGDGAFGYSLIEFETFSRLGIPVIAVVGNDACWSQIAREQVKVLGDDVGTRLAHTDYHEAAEALGGRGFLLDDPAKTREVLAAAKREAANGKAVLINALIGTTSFREGSISM
jgi:acetolactate synthase-1/2/3 large subunit